jgi:alpha,alpha-trehalose phosphorylase
MRNTSAPGHLPAHRFPPDPWRLVEVEHDDRDLGVTETLFAVANGYIGMRANPPEGRDAHSHGTFLNGFHETWDIQHAESAHAFAKTGQTIVNAPDAKLMKLYIDDEPLLIGEADLESYERGLDFAGGYSWRDVIWQTPSGKRVKVRTTRMASLVHRHLAVFTFELELLEGRAPVVVSSQLLNRQDGEDEYHVPDAALGEGIDPRQARKFDQRVLEPRLQHQDDSGLSATLGYRCPNSRMTLACGYLHTVESASPYEVDTVCQRDQAKSVFRFIAEPDSPIRITKYVAYHSSRGVPTPELADRCARTVDRARSVGLDALRAEQREWLDRYWAHGDIEIDGSVADQQALRWNLFQLAQASACTNEQGIAAKGVTAGGYDGHYFWDTEVYVLPFLSYTDPHAARKLLRFRWKMLDAARQRARELSQTGALYPWRTINGEEASAYYAAGTAQYHINAAVAFAIDRYVTATGDVGFLASEGAEVLVETARLWEDLGFYGNNGRSTFHIHRVTGPDEYTTVVNDNFYTNVMARFNLSFAAGTVRWMAEERPGELAAIQRRTGLTLDEVDGWERAADCMYIPYDAELRVHPQDDAFLDLELWDFDGTPTERYPLLLHFHPLVIYRHQVLKQADVVLAMFLRGEEFDQDQRQRNFEYYDPITTGDSSLSACVQAIVAAQVDKPDRAWCYFQNALQLDLLNTHGNTSDGVHIASAGGTWAAVVYGFAGMLDRPDGVHFTPRLPEAWDALRFRLIRRGVRFQVELSHDSMTIEVISGGTLPVVVDGATRMVEAGQSIRIGTAGAPITDGTEAVAEAPMTT